MKSEDIPNCQNSAEIHNRNIKIGLTEYGNVCVIS